MPDMPRGESLLFCTPPPEEMQASVNGYSEQEGYSMCLSDEPDTPVEWHGGQQTDTLVSSKIGRIEPPDLKCHDSLNHEKDSRQDSASAVELPFILLISRNTVLYSYKIRSKL